MKVPIKICIYLITLFAISACSTMNDQFSCPLKPGVSCQSLDAVNAKIDRGEIGISNDSEEKMNIRLNTVSKNIVDNNSDKQDEPSRLPEKVLRVWVAPYEDTQGNYHEASEILTVV